MGYAAYGYIAARPVEPVEDIHSPDSAVSAISKSTNMHRPVANAMDIEEENVVPAGMLDKNITKTPQTDQQLSRNSSDEEIAVVKALRSQDRRRMIKLLYRTYREYFMCTDPSKSDMQLIADEFSVSTKK